MKYLLLTFFILLSICDDAKARHYDLTAQRISTADGLPTNVVGGIWQDEDGFIYLETRSGVCRWDGYALMPTPQVGKQSGEETLRTLDAEWQRVGKGKLARIGKDGNQKSWQLIAEEVMAYTRNDHFHVADVDFRTEAISTYGGGLYFYDKPTGEMTRIGEEVIDNPYLTNLFVDCTGCIWVVEDFLGVKCLRKNGLVYQRQLLEEHVGIQDENHVRSMLVEDGTRLLVGNQMGGLYDCDLRGGECQQVSQMNNRVYAMMRDGAGQLWIGTRGSGLWVNGRPVDGLPSPDIYKITEGIDGSIWVAMLQGGVAKIEGCCIKAALAHKNCHDILQSRLGLWWVAAEDSLYVLDEAMQPVVAYAGYYVCLAQDRDGHIWAGSIGGGVVGYVDGRPMHYTTRNGLATNNVYSIVEDTLGYLWLGTEEGLSCLNTETGNVRNYVVSDSPLANVFNERAAVCLADGRLVFGSHEGLLLVTPAEDRQSVASVTKLTGIRVNGFSADMHEPLSHRQNNVTFFFSNCQYAALGSVLYQFRLMGVDREWSLPTKEHVAVYRNLKPGTYMFQVRSKTGMGDWGSVATLPLYIKEPWWNTWWAWLIYLLLAGGMVLLVIMTVRRILHLYRQLEVERQVSAFKQDFYNRMERELRNPINVLQGATENVQISGTSKTTLLSLRRGSRRMLKLMDMIQQFHRLNKVELQVKAECDSMNEEAEKRFKEISQAIRDGEKEFRELAPPPINGQTLVIVEEDEDNLTHLTDTLNPYFKVCACASILQCESFLQKEQPAVLLLDITSDEQGYYNLTRKLHAAWPALPIVHLSSWNDDAHQLRSLRAGAADYVVKPFGGKVLLERVAKLIARGTIRLQEAKSRDLEMGGIQQEEREGGSSVGVLTDVKDKMFLDRFYLLLSQHVTEENFSVERLAELMHLGRTQLYKKVKTLTGKTPAEHLHRARLDEVARLLCSLPQLTVEEVMIRTGFRNATHFYHAFKRQFGMSPREYRVSKL